MQRHSWLPNNLFIKISNIVYFTSAILFTVNDYDEHVEFLYECMLFPLCMKNNCICVCSTSMHSVSAILCTYVFMGLVAWMVNAMVASSSSVGGSGTLQCGIRAHVAAWA